MCNRILQYRLVVCARSWICWNIQLSKPKIEVLKTLVAGLLTVGCSLVFLHAQASPPGQAQPPSPGASQGAAAASRSVWDGVYAEDQAKRGETLYGRECSSCHGQKLAGD